MSICSHKEIALMCVCLVFSYCYILEWGGEGNGFGDIPQYKFLRAVCFTDLSTGAVK